MDAERWREFLTTNYFDALVASIQSVGDALKRNLFIQAGSSLGVWWSWKADRVVERLRAQERSLPT